jgi:hypothetical protein
MWKLLNKSLCNSFIFIVELKFTKINYGESIHIGSLFYLTNISATSCRLLYYVNVAHSADRSHTQQSSSGK